MADKPIDLIIEQRTIVPKKSKLLDDWTIEEGSSPAINSTTLSAKDYFSSHMVEFKPFHSTSSLSLDILPILIGKKWDDLALGIVHSVRPSSIRVVKNGFIKLDIRTWRVTIFLDENDCIERITQECTVGLPDGVEHGRHLRLSLMAGEITPSEGDSFWYCPNIPNKEENE